MLNLSSRKPKNLKHAYYATWILLILLLIGAIFETHVVNAQKDKTPPKGSIVINNDNEFTDSIYVTLTLTAKDPQSGINEVRFSNDGKWNKPWEKFSSTKSWTLTSGDGEKTVYYQIKNNDNLISETYTDTIILETQPTPTSQLTPTPSPTPIPTITPQPTPSPTLSPSPSPTITPSPSPTLEPTPTTSPTPSSTPSPTQEPTPTPTSNPNETNQIQPSPTPNSTPNADQNSEDTSLISSQQVFSDLQNRRNLYYVAAGAVFVIGVILVLYILFSE